MRACSGGEEEEFHNKCWRPRRGPAAPHPPGLRHCRGSVPRELSRHLPAVMCGTWHRRVGRRCMLQLASLPLPGAGVSAALGTRARGDGEQSHGQRATHRLHPASGTGPAGLRVAGAEQDRSPVTAVGLWAVGRERQRWEPFSSAVTLLPGQGSLCDPQSLSGWRPFREQRNGSPSRSVPWSFFVHGAESFIAGGGRAALKSPFALASTNSLLFSTSRAVCFVSEPRSMSLH